MWRVGNESSLTLKCKDGRASINFHCNLGRPDQAHTQDGRQRHQKVKKKSASRVLKNNARAARHQAATRPFLPPAQPGIVTSPVPVTPSRTVTSLALAQTLPLPTTSLPPAPVINRDLEMWRDIRLCSVGLPHSCQEFYATATEEELETLQRWSDLCEEQAGGAKRRPDLNHLLSGRFYPPSFWCSALQKIRPEYSTPARLVRQDEFRAEIGTRTDDYSESPHPAVNRADDDISRPPSSPLSSPREETGRQGDNETYYSSDSSSESESGDFSEDLPDGLDLQRWRAIQLCTLCRCCVHSCWKYWNTYTEKEHKLLLRWEERCMNQLQAGEKIRPDAEDDNGHYPSAFLCSLLREIRE